MPELPRARRHVQPGLLGKEVVYEELKCEYRGDDACEFTIFGFGGAE